MPCGVDIAERKHVEACKRQGLKSSMAIIAWPMRLRSRPRMRSIACGWPVRSPRDAHWEVCQALRPGMTEFGNRRSCGKRCYKAGAEELEGPPASWFAPGKDRASGVPNMPTRSNVRPGDLCILDIQRRQLPGLSHLFLPHVLRGRQANRIPERSIPCPPTRR